MRLSPDIINQSIFIMEDNLFYGYLSYHRKDSKKNYSIRKRNITIGSQKTNDIRLKKGISDRKYLQLSIVNECNYKLDICTCKHVVVII